jgi:signal peptidase
MKKVLHFLGNLVVALILILAIVMTVAVITSVHSEKVHLPNLFGYAMLSVQSDSMESEDGFNTGDVIIVRMLDTEEANNLSVGDVISFIRSLEGQDYLETHRIVSCEGDSFIPPQEIVDGIWQRGGTRYYTTKGDNTPGIDKVYGSDQVEYTSCTKIYGIWTGKRVPHLGTVMDFLQSSTGFMICIVLPVALFFIYQLYVFIMTLTRKQKEKALEEVSNKEEELKQKAIAEFLAQQQANGVQIAVPNDKPAEPEPEAPPASEPDSNNKKKRKNKHVKEESAPTDSEDTAAPETPDPPEESAEPAKEADSETPEAPETPETPENTEGSAEPANEADPETPEAPETSEGSAEPAKEADPEAPETPETPEESAEPAKEADSEAPEAPEAPQTPEESAEPAKEADSETPAKPEEAASGSAPADGAPAISEEEKERIIQEYLAKQAQENKD